MSFAQEVRDFLAGYQAVDEMFARKEERARAREEFEMKKAAAQTKAAGGSGSSGERPMTEYQRAMLALRGEELEFRKTQAEATAAAAAAANEAKTAAQLEAERAAAAEAAIADIPVDGYADWAPEEAAAEEETPAFADGGVVPSKQAPDLFNKPQPKVTPQVTPAPPQRSALPMPEKAPAPAAVKQTIAGPVGAPEAPSEPTMVVMKKAGEAAAAAMYKFTQDSKAPKAAVGDEASPNLRAGTGGMTMQEYSAVMQKVDPNNSMPAHMKAMAAQGAAYDYFMEKGETAKAVRASQGFLIANKNATQTLGQLAMHAVESGDLASACRLLNDACNRFPTGHEITIAPDPQKGVVYTVAKGGKVVEQGALNSEQFVQLSTKVADGSLYVDTMAKFAAANAPKKQESGKFGAALEGVSAAAGQLASATEALDMMGEDATEEQRAAAAKRVSDAKKAVASARQQALDLGYDSFSGKGNQASFEAQIKRAVDSAMDTALPVEEPAAAESDAPEAPAPTAVASPKSKAEYDALPSGTRFVDPNGVERIKP